MTYMTTALILKHLQSIADSIFKQLGPGYSEEVYDKAMQVGLRMAGLRYDSQRSLTVEYNGYAVGTARPDFILLDDDEGDAIILDVKAEAKVLKKDRVQVRRYLSLTAAPLGILINFPKGEGGLEFVEVTV